MRTEDAFAPSFTSETPRTAELSDNSISKISEKSKGFSEKSSEEWRKTVTKKKAAEIDEAVKLGAKVGRQVIISDEIAGNGRHDPDGTIYINPNTKNPVRVVLFHELTHDIETSGLYEKLSKSVIKIAEEIDGLDVEQYKDQLREIYGNLAGDGIDREAVASIASERLFDDERMVNRLFQIDQTLFTKIKNWLSDMKVKFFGTDYEKMIRDAEKLYIRAMETRGEAEGYGKGQNFGGTEENDYSNAVDLTDDPELADRIANSDRSRITVIRDYVFEMLGGEDITMSDGIKAIVDKSDAKHIANRARSNKQTAEVSGIKDIIKNAKFYDKVETDHKKYTAFRYYETPVKYGNDISFITVNLGMGRIDNEYHIYDLTEPKERNASSRINGSGRLVSIALGSGVPTDSISNPNKKVNNQDFKGSSYEDMLMATISYRSALA